MRYRAQGPVPWQIPVLWHQPLPNHDELSLQGPSHAALITALWLLQAQPSPSQDQIKMDALSLGTYNPLSQSLGTGSRLIVLVWNSTDAYKQLPLLLKFYLWFLLNLYSEVCHFKHSLTERDLYGSLTWKPPEMDRAEINF